MTARSRHRDRVVGFEAGAGGWWLYLVRCADGTLYTGVTNDLQRRLAQHNHGSASRYTRGRLPVRLEHRERCESRSSALKKEARMKSLSRKEKEEYIKGRTGSAPEAG